VWCLVVKYVNLDRFGVVRDCLGEVLVCLSKKNESW
jgi:hypothetical protein